MAGDTKSDADLGRAKRFKKTATYRKASREVYKAATPKQRKAVRGGKTQESRVARKQSKDFKRAEGYKREAQKFLKTKPGPEDLAAKKGEERERLKKGLRVLTKQAAADEIRGGLRDLDRLRVRPTLKVAPEKKSSGIGAVADAVVGGAQRLMPLTSQIKTVGDVLKVTGQDDTVAGDIQKRLEKGPVGPLTKAQKEVVKGTLDGTTKALTQLSRPSSAVAGGVTDLSLKSAVKGFKENNRSFEELARKAGLDGLDAEILGLTGDVVIDPTSWATFGASAPLTAARKSAQETAQRTLRAADKKITRAAKAGKITEEEADRLRAAAAKAQRENLERVLAKPTAKAQKQRAKSKDGEQPRALQVGFRGAGRQKHVSVRVPGSRKVGEVQRRSQQTAALNDLTTKLSTKAPGVDVTRPQKNILREIERTKRGESNVLLRKAERVAAFFKKQKYDDDELRRIITAIEKGAADELEPRLREGAVRFASLTEEGRTRLESLLGKEVGLDERMLPPGELENLAARVTKEASRASKKAATKADKLVDSPEEAGALARAAERAQKAASDIPRRAVDRESERAVVKRLRESVDALNAERMPLAVNRRVKEVIGEVRQGGEAADAYPALAKALRDADEARAISREVKASGVETRAVIAARKKHVAARKVVKAHHAAIAREIENAMAEDGMRTLGGRTGRMLENAERKVAKETPKGYVPRDQDLQLRARFGDKEAKKQVKSAPYARTKADSENARTQHRERRDLMADEVAKELSIDMTLLAANYGLDVANRIYRGGVLQEVFRRTGMRPTRETIENAPTELVAYRRVGGDIPQRLTPKEEQALFKGRIDDIDDLFVIPKPIDDEITALQNNASPKSLGRFFRRSLRKWKEFNTIARPGFFVNNFVSNNWQLFLADAKGEIAGQFSKFARLKADELIERNGETAFAKILDKLGVNPTFTLLDGSRMTRAEIQMEGAESGALRTGSRLGYKLDEDLSPMEQTKRQVGLGGALGKAGSAVRTASTKAGNLAEDFDDMARGAIYEHARVKLGMSKQEATEHVYTVMIDYGDLTDFEQRYIKNVMPFYVYTSRNVPMQVKKLMQRPGKIANFEKVIEELADLSGLPEDWEQMLGESDQERMPVPIPGLKVDGRQMFRDLRLPVGDLRRPAQALDGMDGLTRLAKMYGADVGPYLRAPLELAFNRRLDFDRPIYGPQATPTEAGALIGLAEKLAGWDSKKTEEFTREDGKYNPTNNKVSYLLRALGSYPSLALGVGTKGADRTGRDIKVRSIDSLVGQGSMIPNAPETFLYGKVSEDLDDAYVKRNELKEGSAAYYRQQDRIDELKEIKAGLTKLAGIKGRTGERADRDLKTAQRRKMKPGSKRAIDTTGELRALDADIRKIREAVRP